MSAGKRKTRRDPIHMLPPEVRSSIEPMVEEEEQVDVKEETYVKFFGSLIKTESVINIRIEHIEYDPIKLILVTSLGTLQEYVNREDGKKEFVRIVNELWGDL